MLLIFFLVFGIVQRTVQGNVRELNDGDFNFEIGKPEVAVVLFYAPWCYHCVNFKKQFKIAAMNLSGSHPTIAFIQVDCTDRGRNTCDKHKIKAYPKVKIFKKGEYHEDYDGPRKADVLQKYMAAQVGPSTREIYTRMELKHYLAEEFEPCIVGYFLKKTPLMAAYLEAADQLRGKFRCAHIGYPDLLEELGLNDTLILYRAPFLNNSFEDRNITYTGPAHHTEILKFIKDNIHGLVGLRTLDSMEAFQPPLIVAYFNVDFQKNGKNAKYWRNRILSVASNFPTIKFAISPHEDFPFELQDFGLDPDNMSFSSPLVAAWDANGNRYLMKTKFSPTNLFVFTTDFINSNLEPYVKSEPIPDNNGTLPIKVVMTTFEEIVLKSDKDVFLYLYEPKSSKCKEFNKTFEKLSKVLRNEDKIIIAHMNVFANDVPPCCSQNSDLPGLYWFGKHSKGEPMLYEGGRTFKEVLQFIAKQATEELRRYDRNGNQKPEAGAKEEL